jgi:ankyrin repeat protein
MVRLAVYPPSRAAPDSTDFVGEAFGSVDRRRCTGNGLQGMSRCISTLRASSLSPPIYPMPLAKHARLGNLEMVRHLIDTDTDTRRVSCRDGNPLVEACRRCHEDVVNLLLERGADPNFDGDEERIQGSNPIAIAAASGSLAIVRRLLGHGADLCHEDLDIEMGYHALNAAVRLEHTDMVKFLAAAGFDLEIYGETILKSALSQGLDSMIEILREGLTLSRYESAVGEHSLERRGFMGM